MNLSHFEALFVFALFVSIVLGVITTRDTPSDQFRYGVFVFCSFLGVGILVGWLMYPLPW